MRIIKSHSKNSNYTFKVNGERNSGTTFLLQLLQDNNFFAIDNYIIGDTVLFWKHGTPNGKIRLKIKNLVDVFIIRDLESWLVSMYHHPYHLVRSRNFTKFLTSPMKLNTHRQIDSCTKLPVNITDRGKTIFEIRYYKIKKILKYFQLHNNCIIISLKYLQKNYIHFLQQLSKRYSIPFLCKKFQSVCHTKTGRNQQNRKYNINIHQYRDIIDDFQDYTIESRIDDNMYLSGD